MATEADRHAARLVNCVAHPLRHCPRKNGQSSTHNRSMSSGDGRDVGLRRVVLVDRDAAEVALTHADSRRRDVCAWIAGRAGPTAGASPAPPLAATTSDGPTGGPAHRTTSSPARRLSLQLRDHEPAAALKRDVSAERDHLQRRVRAGHLHEVVAAQVMAGGKLKRTR
jgi:hypothetical protein